MKKRTILFGIDGATWDLVDRFVEEGSMPNMKYVLERGVKGVMMSTFPTETMAAWTSIFTGVNPGKHGMPDFRLRINNNIEIAQSRYRTVETIWQLISKKGLRSIVINDPVTYPPDAINGIMTTGLMTPPKSNYIYPTELRSEVDRVVEGYMCEPPEDFYKKAIEVKPEAYAMLERVATKQARAALHLAKNYEWDVLAPIFTTSDRLQHVFFADYDYLKRHYALLDGFLKEFLDIADNNNANLLIVSDHGFGPVKKALYINTWLNREGFQKIKKSAIRSMLVSKGFTVYKLKELIGNLHLSSVALKFYRISPRMIKDALPLGDYEDNQTDYSTSQAFSTAYHGIYLNGNLTAKEYQQVREAIMKKLSLVTDNDTMVVEKLYRREEVLWGPYSDRSPDIFVVTRVGYGMSTHLNPNVFDKLENHGVTISGSHRLEGIFAAFGPDIRNGVKLDKAVRVWDVAPTILQMLGLAIPSYMDGRVLGEIFRDNCDLTKGSVSQEITDERSKIRKRLKNITRTGLS
ncbi:MAG: putative AlkP superfamily phosphohydrolase/phosphomutase [Candidatus Nitrosomirales archaeon]|jgi:predicted AlkP superfamily phosphohydrolase/phosphomutase